MKIFCDIDKSLPKVDRQVAKNRVASKLSRFEQAIEDVQMRLKDLNGPKGGHDTECLISVHLRNMPEVIIHERAENVGKAMFNALDRAARAIAKNLQKKTDFYHRHPEKPESLLPANP